MRIHLHQHQHSCSATAQSTRTTRQQLRHPLRNSSTGSVSAPLGVHRPRLCANHNLIDHSWQAPAPSYSVTPKQDYSTSLASFYSSNVATLPAGDIDATAGTLEQSSSQTPQRYSFLPTAYTDCFVHNVACRGIQLVCKDDQDSDHTCQVPDGGTRRGMSKIWRQQGPVHTKVRMTLSALWIQ